MALIENCTLGGLTEATYRSPFKGYSQTSQGCASRAVSPLAT